MVPVYLAENSSPLTNQMEQEFGASQGLLPSATAYNNNNTHIRQRVLKSVENYRHFYDVNFVEGSCPPGIRKASTWKAPDWCRPSG